MDENQCHLLKKLLEMFHSKGKKVISYYERKGVLKKFNKQEALLTIDERSLCSIWAIEFAVSRQGIFDAQFHTKCKF